jgi:hypothetical protein
MTLTTYSLFALAAATLAHAISIPIGNVLNCTNNHDTPFGQGLLTSHGLASCASPPTVDQLFNPPTTQKTQQCQVWMDSTEWYALLKVHVPNKGIHPTEKWHTLHDRIVQYSGEKQPIVLVFPSGDVFLPAPIAAKATIRCDKSTESQPRTLDTLQKWGVRSLSHLTDQRVVSVGDLHGDLKQAKLVLKLARVVDDKGEWAGGKTILVQTGDTVDRGADTIEIVEWLNGLVSQATAAGGQAIILNGNHEIKNVAGDHSDVGDVERNNPTRYSQVLDAYDPNPQPAPSPKGRLSRIIYQHDGVAQVGTSVFAHGGILSQFAKRGIKGINSDIRSLFHTYAVDTRTNKRDLSEYDVFGMDGPFYTRMYANDKEKKACPELDKALGMFGAKRMVLGHTIQKDNGYRVNSRCSKHVILQDVAISGVYDGGHIGATEIRGDAVWALGPDGWTQLDDGSSSEVFMWQSVQSAHVIV